MSSARVLVVCLALTLVGTEQAYAQIGRIRSLLEDFKEDVEEVLEETSDDVEQEVDTTIDDIENTLEDGVAGNGGPGNPESPPGGSSTAPLQQQAQTASSTSADPAPGLPLYLRFDSGDIVSVANPQGMLNMWPMFWGIASVQAEICRSAEPNIRTNLASLLRFTHSLDSSARNMSIDEYVNTGLATFDRTAAQGRASNPVCPSHMQGKLGPLPGLDQIQFREGVSPVRGVNWPIQTQTAVATVPRQAPIREPNPEVVQAVEAAFANQSGQGHGRWVTRIAPNDIVVASGQSELNAMGMVETRTWRSFAWAFAEIERCQGVQELVIRDNLATLATKFYPANIAAQNRGVSLEQAVENVLSRFDEIVAQQRAVPNSIECTSEYLDEVLRISYVGQFNRGGFSLREGVSPLL